jgi:thymidylate synthase (FAD)
MEANLNVVLLRHTPEPEEVVAMAAKLCYSASGVEELKEKIEAKDQAAFVEKLASIGHLSPIEHVSFTFGIEGISRACSHQLVRHRVASYSQQSQRYVQENQFDYMVPPAIKADASLYTKFESDMADAQKKYTYYISKGISAEDARFLLPNACETKIVVTMNARELLHFFRVRCCNRAQWEIREMADRMLAHVKKAAPTIFGKSGPGCLYAPCPEGKMTCGKIEEVRKKYGVDVTGRMAWKDISPYTTAESGSIEVITERKLDNEPSTLAITSTMMDPNWQPLEDAIGADNCSYFMFMASHLLKNGIIVETYKHILSREYLNLSIDGRTWKYADGGYFEVKRDQAITAAKKLIQQFAT